MRFLIFCAFIGSICALQYPVEYHYRYEGQIASGIPAIRPQVAAFGIRAKLILQMKEKTHGIAKLTDIEIGEYNDDIQCVHLRQPVPFSYRSIPDIHKQTLEQPFVVYFLEESKGHVMDVPQSDVEFITNIRKSVIEMLRLEPVLANLGGIRRDKLSKYISSDQVREAFTVEEESILGRCESEYTINKLEPHDLEEEREIIEKHLKKDVQSESSPRSRTTKTPKLVDEYYRLVRSINFDKCHDIVIQQHAGGANMSHEGHSLFRAVHSRSSISTYILKGHPGSFRIERAMVEGDVIVNPFGFKTEKLQAITNQTMILESTQAIQKSLILPRSVRPVNSWRYEVASPFNPPERHQKQWVNYHNKGDKYSPVSVFSAAGFPLSSQDIQKYQTTILELLDEAVKEFYSEPMTPSPEDPNPRMTKTSLATTRLHAMTHFMRVLPIDKIREIFSKTFQNRDVNSRRKQAFLIDVAAASGASAPIKILLEKMEKHEISPQRIASIFLTLPNNLYSPSVIPELMEYVKRLNMETNPLLTSSALINFASLAERICINPKKFNYSIPHALFGREDCGPSILRDLLPFLEEKAKSASKCHERAIYLQAINNLGSPEIIPVLKPYIFGKIDRDLHVRSTAIYGLSSLRLPDSRKLVFETLMAVVDNTEERPELRQAAFWTLVTWHPSASFWQRMAKSTWKEPSKNMATFIALTIESLAKSTEPHHKHQARIAAFVLPLMKPISPSIRSSYNRIYSRYNPHSKIGINFDFASIMSKDHSAPFQIFTSLRENFGDLPLHIFESSVSPNFHGRERERHPSERRFLQPLDRFERLKQLYKNLDANIYFRAFQNLYQYIPINADVISKVSGKDAERVVRELLSGIQVHVTKYLNPLNLEFFLPTEIGMPLRGHAMMPTVNLGEADFKLVAPGLENPTLKDLLKHHHLSLRFKSNYKYSSKLIVKLSVFNPLSRKFAEAGVENYCEMNMPFYGDISFTRSNEIKNISLSVSPHTQQKFPVFHQHNVPFTVMKNVVPDKDLTKDFKVIGVEKDRRPALKVRKQLHQKYTGVSSEVNYSGDAPYPFTSAFLMDYLRKPEQQGKLLASPVAKQWQYSLSYDPRSSETRNITLALSFVCAQPSQDHNEERIPDFSIKDDPHQRLQKMKQISKAPEVKIHGMNAQLFFNSNVFRRYEAVIAHTLYTTERTASPHKNYRVVGATLASKIPGHFDSPRALCLDSSFETPNIYDLDSLRNSIRLHPKEHMSAQVFYGSSCKSENIARGKGAFKLSEERNKLISEELQKICHHDSRDPTVELQTAAVYDIATLDIDFSKDKIPRAILNATYHLQQFIEGAVFPHGHYNNMFSGEPDKIKIEARRPVSSRKYSFTVEAPHKRSIFSEIHVPFAATKIVPFKGLRATYDKVTNSLLISMGERVICYFKRGSIKTYDKLKYNYRRNACWAILSLNHYNSSDFIIRGRIFKGIPQAQVTLPDESLHMEIDYSRVVVNGKEIDGSESRVVIKDSLGQTIIIERDSMSHKLSYADRMTIFANRNEIRIEPYSKASTFPPSLRGLCGDYDHSKDYDMTGPEECLYSKRDEDLFQYSWTSTEGDGCDTQKVDLMHSNVKEYQKSCEHRPLNKVAKTTHFHRLVEDDDCMMVVYPVIPESGKDGWCAAYEPSHRCKEGCVQMSSEPIKLKAGCWPSNKVPSDVAEGEERGYIYQPPAEKAPIHSHIVGLVAKECKRVNNTRIYHN